MEPDILGNNSKPCLLEDLWEEPWKGHGFGQLDQTSLAIFIKYSKPSPLGMTSKGLKALVPRNAGYSKMLKMSSLQESWITGEEGQNHFDERPESCRNGACFNFTLTWH